MEADAQGQVKSRDHQQCPEPLQQQGNQADLEHVGVEHHQQNDDHVEQDGYVLDAAGTDLISLFFNIGFWCIMGLISAAVKSKQNN